MKVVTKMPNNFNITLNPDFKNCHHFCESIEKHFAEEENSLHKARNEIKKISCQEHSIVVKSFKIPHLLNRLVYTYFRGSKAQKSYDNAVRLQTLGITTPEPIAVIKELTPTLHKSYFLSVAFEYDYTLNRPLREENFFHKKQLFQAFARYSAQLHDKGVLHNDYSQGNILIKEDGDDYIFSIVDINRMVFKTLTLEERYNNFSRLWADEEILHIIAVEYAKVTGFNKEEAVREIYNYDQKHKAFKNFKRKLKSFKGTV